MRDPSICKGACTLPASLPTPASTMCNHAANACSSTAFPSHAHAKAASRTPGVTLEALSADEDNMQHHYKSQPHRGKQELPWRKARTERRRSRQAQRQANANSLAPPPNTPAGSAFSAAASLDSRESYEVPPAAARIVPRLACSPNQPRALDRSQSVCPAQALEQARLKCTWNRM